MILAGLKLAGRQAVNLRPVLLAEQVGVREFAH